VQVKGKLRGTVSVPAGSSEAEVLEAAKLVHAIAVQLGDQPIRKVIYVPDKMLNVIV
jgi:leucyl-tRNA synthetase